MVAGRGCDGHQEGDGRPASEAGRVAGLRPGVATLAKLCGWSDATAAVYNTLTANEPPPPEGVVYRHFDAAGVLLYVGSSDVEQVNERHRTHARSAPWWPYVERVEREQCADRRAAFATEREAMRNERPVFNRTRTNGSPEECRTRIERYVARSAARPV